jgi:hypothetical protein
VPRLLIWGPEHWGGGQPRPCITCGRPALLVDDRRQPQHKVCAEALADAAEAQTTTRYYEKRPR